jgi:hypothetical protein
MVIMVVTTGIALYLAVQYSCLIRSIRKEILKYSYGNDLSWDCRRIVSQAMETVLRENEQGIVANIRDQIQKKIDDADNMIESRVDSIIQEELKNQVVSKTTDEYLKKNMIGIFSKLDVTAVSNAVLLQLTGSILKNDKLTQIEHR